MKRVKMRRAFSMITAIFVIVLMATVAVLILNLSSKMVKETTIQYFREQSMLLAKSYTEYAVMAVTANERNSTSGNCLDDIHGTYSTIYNIDVNISYIGNGTGLGDASKCSRQLSNSVTTEKTPLNIIIDVFVRYKDPDRNATTAPWITYHRRTLQKI